LAYAEHLGPVPDRKLGEGSVSRNGTATLRPVTFFLLSHVFLER